MAFDLLAVHTAIRISFVSNAADDYVYDIAEWICRRALPNIIYIGHARFRFYRHTMFCCAGLQTNTFQCGMLPSVMQHVRTLSTAVFSYRLRNT